MPSDVTDWVAEGWDGPTLLTAGAVVLGFLRSLWTGYKFRSANRPEISIAVLRLPRDELQVRASAADPFVPHYTRRIVVTVTNLGEVRARDIRIYGNILSHDRVDGMETPRLTWRARRRLKKSSTHRAEIANLRAGDTSREIELRGPEFPSDIDEPIPPLSVARVAAEYRAPDGRRFWTYRESAQGFALGENPQEAVLLRLRQVQPADPANLGH